MVRTKHPNKAIQMKQEVVKGTRRAALFPFTPDTPVEQFTSLDNVSTSSSSPSALLTASLLETVQATKKKALAASTSKKYDNM
jgi:hypothetical protein